MLAKLPRISLSVPAAEVDGAAGDGGAERDGVGAGAAGEGLDVGDGGRVGALPRVSVSVPAPRSIDAGGDGGAQGDGVGAGAAGDGLDVGDRAGVGDVGEGQLVGAGAEIDASCRSASCRA